MVRRHHAVIQVALWMLTIGCAFYALNGSGLSAIVAAIFVVALRVEANTGGVLVPYDEPVSVKVEQ